MKNEKYKGKNVIWESKTKQIFTILGCFIFTFIALWIGKTNEIHFWPTIILFGFGGLFMLYRFLNPKNIFVTYKSKIGKEILAERTEFEQNDFGIFEYNKNGIKISIEKTIENYKWSEINTVYGYKIDLLTYDEICIDILTIDQNKYTITESTSGWFQFISRLSENIKSIEIDWYLKIANPAFEKNLTLLFDKRNRKIEEIRNENVILEKHNS